MWSGPRNISTAMMRSFGGRADTAVSDEPFYGCFLKQTGLPHPMADEVIEDMDCDWSSVVATMAGPVPEGKAVWYQKQMTHHMVGPVAPDDLQGVRHAFLIRSPVHMIASYLAKMESVSPEALGLSAQRAFFDREADRLGAAPAIIDSADVLANPHDTLSALCTAIGIDWDEGMLSWSAGRRETDGIWASHWYERVDASTGFERPATGPEPQLSGEGAHVAKACEADYQYLKGFALR